MPKFKKSAIQRGAKAIRESASKASQGGNFRPFTPEIWWKGDGAERYVLFLTPVEEVPRFDIHEYIEVGKGKKANGESFTRYAKFMCRQVPAIGEACKLCDLDNDAKDRHLAVAVELEPILEKKGKRNKVVGFEALTHTFERGVKGDDDEWETEEVTAPSIGVVTQSGSNFFGFLGDFNDKQAPIEDTPFQVIRRGETRNVNYDFIHFMDRPVDLTAVIEHLDGISYLEDDLEEIVAALDDTKDDHEAALVVANYLLDHHVDELADEERFDELVGPIEHIENRFGGNDRKKSDRPRRASSRRSRKSEEPEESENGASAADDDSNGDEPADQGGSDESGLSRSERFEKLRKSLKSKD